MNLRNLSDIDQPKRLSVARSIGESIWFQSVREKWLLEDAGHLPTVEIYCEAYGCDRSFFVDRDGPIMDNRKSRPYEFLSESGEYFVLPRTCVGDAAPVDQIWLFGDMFDSHSYCRGSGLPMPMRADFPPGLVYRSAMKLGTVYREFLLAQFAESPYKEVDDMFAKCEQSVAAGISLGAIAIAASEADMMMSDTIYEDADRDCFKQFRESSGRANDFFLWINKKWRNQSFDSADEQPIKIQASKETLAEYDSLDTQAAASVSTSPRGAKVTREKNKTSDSEIKRES